MRRTTLGRCLIGAVAIAAVVLPVLADWNATHIFNPRWPPHARLHSGQTIAVGLLTGALALWALQRGRAGAGEAARFAAIYWLAQALAFLTPGAAAFDAELAARLPAAAEFLLNPLTLDLALLALLLVGHRLAQDGAADGPRVPAA